MADDKKVMISVRLTPELLAKLDAIRDAQLIVPTRAAVIERALADWVADHAPEPTKGKKGGSK